MTMAKNYLNQLSLSNEQFSSYVTLRICFLTHIVFGCQLHGGHLWEAVGFACNLVCDVPLHIFNQVFPTGFMVLFQWGMIFWFLPW
jgi:hypothetical protein